MATTLIIGNSGSGKTWLAKRLGRKHNTAVTHLDNIFWMPGGFDIKREPSEVTRLMEDALRQNDWIVEGVFGDLANAYLADAEVLVWLDLPWEICEQRLQARGSESKAHLGRKQSEQGLRDLLQWAQGYYARTNSCSYARHREMFDSFKGMKYRFTTESEVLAYFKHDV